MLRLAADSRGAARRCAASDRTASGSDTGRQAVGLVVRVGSEASREWRWADGLEGCKRRYGQLVVWELQDPS